METKKCPKCEIDLFVSEFYKSKSTKDGLRHYCKSCEKKKNAAREPEYKAQRKEYRKTDKYKEIKRIYYKENKETVLATNKKWNSTLSGKYSSYKNSANIRKIQWKLDLEQFSTFWKKSCYYCDDPIETIGIDRVDSNGIYELKNCIPCCGTCNKIKLDLPQQKFIEQVKKIYKNLCQIGN